jgi:hypothetical protein
MNEQIRRHLAGLNAVWQRCASIANDSPDLATANALRREYVRAWESLEAYGVAEWMLVYDPETMTFSLPEMREQNTDMFATMPMPAMTNQTVRGREKSHDPHTESLPRI